MELAELLNPPFSPLQSLKRVDWDARGLQISIKRDDLLAPTADDPFCGNKWRKLQYNLADALSTIPKPKLLSFGGAYSNHIAALASAGRQLSLDTIGVIRGEAVDNPTLIRARKDGMELYFVDRTTYRRRNDADYLADLQRRFGPNVLIIPEGGSNTLALSGCRELGLELLMQMPDPPTHVLLACGTGGTLAGLALGLQKVPMQIVGVSVLKGNFLSAAVRDFYTQTQQLDPGNWRILDGFHHGGYAKRPPELIDFIYRFQDEFGIKLDAIYTGKVAWALEQLIAQDYFPAGSRIVMVHTGGLQGARDLWGA